MNLTKEDKQEFTKENDTEDEEDKAEASVDEKKDDEEGRTKKRKHGGIFGHKTLYPRIVYINLLRSMEFFLYLLL